MVEIWHSISSMTTFNLSTARQTRSQVNSVTRYSYKHILIPLARIIWVSWVYLGQLLLTDLGQLVLTWVSRVYLGQLV